MDRMPVSWRSMKSSSSLKALAAAFMLLYMGFYVYGVMGQSSIGCNVTAAGTCSFTMVLYVRNDTGGYMNAHAQLPSVADYPYGICCNSTSGTIGTSCGTAFLVLSGSTNAHVEDPSVGNYTYDACINSSAGLVRCYNTTGSCNENSTCLLSYSSGSGNNATNAHVGPCGFYETSMCCVQSIAPDITEMILNSTYGNNYTDEDLDCYVKVSDVDNATTNIYWQWWNSSTLMFNGRAEGITVGELTLIATLGSGNTTRGEEWKCSAIAGDGAVNDTEWTNRTLTIENKPPPAFTNIYLNSTDPSTNNTQQNLTLWFKTNPDTDGDRVYNITDWRVGTVSIARLNLPFESNRTGQSGSVIRDYSTHGNNATISGDVAWVEGKIGGAYTFGGSDDYMSAGNPATLNFGDGSFTVSFWAKTSKSGGAFPIYKGGYGCLLYTSPSPRDLSTSRMPSSA